MEVSYSYIGGVLIAGSQRHCCRRCCPNLVARLLTIKIAKSWLIFYNEEMFEKFKSELEEDFTA